MDYILGKFERETLQRIIKVLAKEHAYSQTGGYTDPIALATSASALNALVSLIRVNIRAQDVADRLDTALDQMSMTEREDASE